MNVPWLRNFRAATVLPLFFLGMVGVQAVKALYQVIANPQSGSWIALPIGDSAEELLVAILPWFAVVPLGEQAVDKEDLVLFLTASIFTVLALFIIHRFLAAPSLFIAVIYVLAMAALFIFMKLSLVFIFIQIFFLANILITFFVGNEIDTLANPPQPPINSTAKFALTLFVIVIFFWLLKMEGVYAVNEYGLSYGSWMDLSFFVYIIYIGGMIITAPIAFGVGYAIGKANEPKGTPAPVAVQSRKR